MQPRAIMWPRSIPACAGAPGASTIPGKPQRVYPRLRGGTPQQLQRRLTIHGLSPLARGHHALIANGGTGRGSIPACAGAPCSIGPPQGVIKVYPRLRGGTFNVRLNVAKAVGLSPLARGHPVCPRACGSVSGSIPACAGAPCSIGPPQGVIKVYPRLRGGTFLEANPNHHNQGLSPLARGHPRLRKTGRGRDGSIPACAGAPLEIGASAQKERVYPRLRGGTVTRIASNALSPGLSPLARGHHYPNSGDPYLERSIPACAGAPYFKLCVCIVLKVYPRLRGGTGLNWQAISSTVGLSPLARGHPSLVTLSTVRYGSIPACAGAPGVLPPVQARAWVYPRLRGGTQERRRRHPPTQGLSPLARGHRPNAAEGSLSEGSIPACAGAPGAAVAPGLACGVYPRLRGGTAKQAFRSIRSTGLSPLARGHPGLLYSARSACRSIPACAGAPRASTSGTWGCWVYPRLRGGTFGQEPEEIVEWGLSPLARGHRRSLSAFFAFSGSIPACAGAPLASTVRRRRLRVYPRLRGGTTGAWM